MTTPVDTARSALFGSPPDPTKKPDQGLVLQAFDEMWLGFTAVQSGALARATIAELNAITAAPVAQMAVVIEDNGIYSNTGTTSAAVWTRLGDFLTGTIPLTNVGAGTANAIEATSTIPLPAAAGRAIFLINIITPNTSDTVTLSVNGATPKPVKTATGNNPPVGGLVASYFFMADDGTNFRVMGELSGAAYQAACEAAQAAAEAAQAAAEAAAAAAAQKFTPVLVVDVGSGDPSTDYEAGNTIDGIALVAGKFVLRASVGGDPADGVYTIPASGVASRASNFAAYDDLPGSYFSVTRGTTYEDTLWRVVSDEGGTLGVTDVVLEQFVSSGGGSSNEFADVATLLADVAMSYSSVAENDVIKTSEYGFRYKVAASAASDHHVATAGGVKLYVLPGSDGAYNVKAFGATGDGVTAGDAAIVQTAINAASADGGGAIFIPAGSFVWDSNVELKSNVEVFGIAPASKLLLTGNNRQALYTDSATDWSVHGLFFDGQKPTVGWETTNNYDFGVRIGENATGRDAARIKIYGNTFKDIGLDGVMVRNADRVEIFDNNFINCRRWGLVPEPGVYGLNDLVERNNSYDQDYGGGPTGKEYPLGAIDTEPYDGGHGSCDLIRYVETNSYKGDLSMLDEGAGVNYSEMVNVRVQDAKINLNNGDFAVSGELIGDDAYLRSDLQQIGPGTTIRKIDLTFQNSRNEVRINGRRNLLPVDYCNEASFNITAYSDGGGSSTGGNSRQIDGKSVTLTNISSNGSAGGYLPGHDLTVGISAGDQVVIYLEVNRTDGNAANNNFFKFAIADTWFTRQKFIPNGRSKLLYAFRAPSTIASGSRVRMGIDGTPGVAVSLEIEKCFIFVNPKHLRSSDLIVR